MGLRSWWREQWKQYTCPHDDTVTEHFFYGVRRRCRKCGLVWTLPSKGPGWE